MIRLRWSRTSIAAALAIAAGGCMAVTGEPLDGDAQTGGQAAGDYPAVGAILADGQPRCTGTLIATGAVLTAAHCVEGIAAFTFTSGVGAASAAAPGSAYVVTRVISHPLYATDPGSGARVNDLAVLLLGQQAAEEPLSFNREDAIGLTGQNAVLIGHGMNAQPGRPGQPESRRLVPTAAAARAERVGDASPFLLLSRRGEAACPDDTRVPALSWIGADRACLCACAFVGRLARPRFTRAHRRVRRLRHPGGGSGVVPGSARQRGQSPPREEERRRPAACGEAVRAATVVGPRLRGHRPRSRRRVRILL